MADDRLELLLSSMPIEFPPTPSMLPAVRAGAAVPRHRVVTPLGRALALGLAAALLVAGLAIAGAFGVGPMRIIFSSALPTPNVTPTGTRLALGDRLTLDELAVRTDLALLAPAGHGEPDEAYLLPSGIVTLVYAADPPGGLPAMDGSDIGLLVMLIPGDLEPSLVEKVVVEFQTSLQEVAVDGHMGYWISGAPHILRYLDDRGRDGGVQTRLVDTTLAWQQDGMVVRLESGLGRDGTVALGESLAPMR